MALGSDGAHAAPKLRKLQSSLNKLLFSIEDKNLLLLSFFLDSFIDNLFFNLSGDVPYSEVIHSIISNIFKSLGKPLENIANGLNKVNFNVCTDAFGEMVNIYLEGLKHIQEKTSEEVNIFD